MKNEKRTMCNGRSQANAPNRIASLRCVLALSAPVQVRATAIGSSAGGNRGKGVAGKWGQMSIGFDEVTPTIEKLDNCRGNRTGNHGNMRMRTRKIAFRPQK